MSASDEADPFFPSLRPTSMDRALVRRRQRDSFLRAAGRLDLDRVLDVGSGRQPWRTHVDPSTQRYIAIDLDTYPGSPPPDLRWDGRDLPVRDGWATTVLLTEVLEHSPDPGGLLAEVQRVLEPSGAVYFTVPFLWPVHDSPHDEFRYTPFAMERLLRGAGLRTTDMWALGGWNAALAQLLGLWARRRPMSRPARAVASMAVFPVVCVLDRTDRQPPLGHDGMITGLGGIAQRSVEAHPGR